MILWSEVKEECIPSPNTPVETKVGKFSLPVKTNIVLPVVVEHDEIAEEVSRA